MKKTIISITLMSLLLISLIFAQEYDWDKQGVQTFTILERILRSFTSGATIPSQCSLTSHTQKVFDASILSNPSSVNVGSACYDGDYVALFNCGLSSKYTSPTQCSYGGSIREGYKLITSVALNADNRYMYFCYNCEAPPTGDKLSCAWTNPPTLAECTSLLTDFYAGKNDCEILDITECRRMVISSCSTPSGVEDEYSCNSGIIKRCTDEDMDGIGSWIASGNCDAGEECAGLSSNNIDNLCKIKGTETLPTTTKCYDDLQGICGWLLPASGYVTSGYSYDCSLGQTCWIKSSLTVPPNISTTTKCIDDLNGICGWLLPAYNYVSTGYPYDCELKQTCWVKAGTPNAPTIPTSPGTPAPTTTISCIKNDEPFYTNGKLFSNTGAVFGIIGTTGSGGITTANIGDLDLLVPSFSTRYRAEATDDVCCDGIAKFKESKVVSDTYLIGLGAVWTDYKHLNYEIYTCEPKPTIPPPTNWCGWTTWAPTLGGMSPCSSAYIIIIGGLFIFITFLNNISSKK